MNSTARSALLSRLVLDAELDPHPRASPGMGGKVDEGSWSRERCRHGWEWRARVWALAARACGPSLYRPVTTPSSGGDAVIVTALIGERESALLFASGGAGKAISGARSGTASKVNGARRGKSRLDEISALPSSVKRSSRRSVRWVCLGGKGARPVLG